MGSYSDRSTGNIPRITIFLVLVWSFAVSGSLVLNGRQTNAAVEELARAEARGVFNKDLAYRRWTAQQGGVYVPITPATPPNPYLDRIEERDITTPSGRQLTLVNPAYMTRQVHELSLTQYGLRGHITSLRPIRPENAPDDWEKGALESFDVGAEEYSEFSVMEGELHLRLMRPMFIEEGCLKCHSSDGFEVGDIRGGMSIAVPMEPYEQVAWEQRKITVLAHAGFWLLGCVGLGIGGGLVRRRERDRQRAETAQTRSESMYQDLFDSAPMPYFIVGIDGRVQASNEAAWEFTGYGQDELSGMPIEDLYDPSSLPTARQLFEDYKGGAKIVNQEMTYRTRDGREMIGLLSVAPIEDDTGQVQRSRSVVLDITEHKKLQGELHVARRLEAIGRLAGGVAHDFNNLLTVIMTCTEFLERRLSEQGAQTIEVRTISKAADKAAQLTSQLLAFSRRHTQNLEVLAFNEIVADLQELLGRVLNENIDLNVSVEEDIWHVRADRSQMEQIVMNLAMNARDAMPEGGTLRIEVANVELDDEFPQLQDGVTPGQYVMVCVADDGEGMDAQTRSKVFEPFFTTKEMGKGTGLGLATVYGIIKQSGGHVCVYSEPSQGTTFKIYLPVVEEALTRNARQPASDKGLEGSESILLVEDDAAVRESVHRTLTAAGYEVTGLDSGAEALEICGRRSSAFQLLLTDVVMPGLNGVELATKVEAMAPGTRIVFMSGYSETASAERGALPSGTRLLSKPFSSNTLLRMIREALDQVD